MQSVGGNARIITGMEYSLICQGNCTVLFLKSGQNLELKENFIPDPLARYSHIMCLR